LTKLDTRRKQLLDLWDDDDDVKEAIKEKIPKAEQDKIDEDDAIFEAEAALVYVGSYEDFFQSTCVGCDRTFAASYPNVTHCSKRCLKKAIEALGFTWDPTRNTEDRWRPKKWNSPPQRRKGETHVQYEKRLQKYRDRQRAWRPVPLTVPSEIVELFDQAGVVPLDKVPMKPNLTDAPTHQTQSRQD
jgi:hypothetical protein